MPKASERAMKLAREVLAKIAAYDGQFLTPNPVTIAAWAEHISLRNPEREDMLEAVAKFYERNEDVKPLPASISNIAQSLRQDRLMRESTQSRQEREDARDRELEAQEQLSIGSAKPRGTYVNEDPAGWTYGNATTRAEREAMRVELDARIDAFIADHPKASRADAEHIIRVKDRERAEKFLKQFSRGVGHVIGDKHPGEVERAFSEPIRGGDDG